MAILFLCLMHSIEAMDKANSRFRIGMMFGLMGTVAIAAVFVIRSGKKEKAARIEDFVDKQKEQRGKTPSSNS